MRCEREFGAAPVEEGRLRIDLVTGGEVLAGMRGEWDALLDESGAGVFNAWEWLYPWLRRIGHDRRPYLLAARDGEGRLVGLLPLGLEVRRVLGLEIRRLAFLGESRVGSDYLDVVAARGLEGAVARAFARALRQARGEWDVLDLTDIVHGSPTLPIFEELFAGDFNVRRTERHTCPFEPLGPEPFEAFLRRTARRDNYLRRRRWLERQPGYRIERAERPGELAGPLSSFFHLHALRWAREGGSQGISGPAVESFHRDATYLLAERGQVRLYTMKVGGQAVASVYAILHRDKFIYYQSGYDPAWRSKSVGLVLVGETFRDSLAAGLSEYDFLHGTEAYKADWTSRQRKTVALRIHQGEGRGAWLDRAEEAGRALRGLARSVLPARAVEGIRRLRRRHGQHDFSRAPRL